MFKFIRKRLAIRSYVKRLGRKLRERYGRSRSYTPAQVQRTAQLLGLNNDYLCYALCMYCERGDFDAYHAAAGESCDYDLMWHHISGASHSLSHDLHDSNHACIDVHHSWGQEDWSHHGSGHDGGHHGGANDNGP